MEELIEALQIFHKYMEGVKYPTHCEHEILMVSLHDEDAPSDEDKTRLDELGFFWNDEYDCWASYRYGST